ncbi:glycosyltransferase family 2 protein [Candidatus Thiodictyon syntrophicum]|jgi:glycosyltransferase involved in cell wall biosynthesis|uniref:Glycosyltransferase 2-like domain-containing protein n=1 Tax=Candidatus Thiodictyon syntrophicum TaxID=1166950 RepID=A0A2K8U5K8_9GAMM|nr:glycosyltransferase family A protein [Candidatus Thiodictyon syntrophicum]AUB80679.1 hypothetical protein THSYN_06750 [Candidatus Thiodictyon syntrophicum]
MKRVGLVSIIIPVFNGEEFLAAALASIREQDYASSEIIVVDDGSTDGTGKLVRGLGTDICYLYQGNAGPAAARNRGLAAAQGDLIAFLDADDWWPYDSLSRRVSCLVDDPQRSGVIGYTQLMIGAGSAAPVGDYSPWGAPQATLNLGGVLIQHNAFSRVGGFDETQAYAEDAEWLLRAREAGLRFAVQRTVTLMARRHSGNMTNRLAPSLRFLAQALHHSLARRRAAANLALADFEECR